MVVASVLTMPGDLADNLCQFFIVCKNGTTVAVAAERLAGKEAGTGYSRQVAGAFALIAGTEALCSIFDNRDTVFLRWR